ncbi:MAG: glycosyltransferase [Blastochloris sp.]|nr:glycosyltransferase [Blastochloris sp.]
MPTKMETLGVLLACRNTCDHTKQAVQSLLTQTYKDFQLLVVNDGSEQKTGDYLDSLRDSRVQIIHHQESWGLAPSLNQGLNTLSTKYVARMDSDDIALPERFHLQMMFLARNPEVVVLGGQMKSLQTKKPLGRVPLSHEEIVYRLNWSNAFNHPTVVYDRSKVLAAGAYNIERGMVEDYELWTRLLPHAAMANLPQNVLYYRQHPGQMSAVNSGHIRQDKREWAKSIYRKKLTGLEVSSLFDQQKKWTKDRQPTKQEWNCWIEYLYKLKEISEAGSFCRKSSVGHDLARRLYASVKRKKSINSQEKIIWKQLYKLNPLYCCLKMLSHNL